MFVLREILAFQHRLWEGHQRHLGGPYRAAIARLLLIAWIDHKPLDVSALASATGMVRQRVMRTVQGMSKEGLVTLEKRKTRVVVHLTPQLLNMIIPQVQDIEARYDRLFERIERARKKEKNRGNSL